MDTAAHPHDGDACWVCGRPPHDPRLWEGRTVDGACARWLEADRERRDPHAVTAPITPARQAAKQHERA